MWDPVLDGPSKHETFTQSLVREVYQVGSRTRLGIEAELRVLVREGRVDTAMEESRTSHLTPGISLGAIATEQARLGDVAGAVATARTVEEPDARAGILVAIADARRRASEPVAADAALTEANTAAEKIRGEGWRHWRARRFAEIGLARFRLGQHERARRLCCLALSVADGQRDETRNQTLADVVRASCLVEDTETAAAALQRMSPGGYRERAVGKLAAAFIVANRVEAGLQLLADLKPATRFESLLWTGRLLTRPAHADRAEQLSQQLTELDCLGILVGHGAALQDLGKYAEAAKTQRAAMEFSQKGDAVGSPRHKQAYAESIAKDLALNLARTGHYQFAFETTGQITEPGEKRRIRRSICVCAAEVGDLTAVRQTSTELELSEDRAEVLAVCAAALVTSATACQPHEGLFGSARRLATRTTSKALICEAIQLARETSAGADRDRLFWLIAGASTKAGFIEEAAAAAMMIRDPETCEQAMQAVLRLPMPDLE